MRVHAHLSQVSFANGFALAVRSKKYNFRIQPTDPGVAMLRDFESVGPDRPTRHAERGEDSLGTGLV